jgi:hypothetical protein
MKLCDCFCYVGGLNDGVYRFKNIRFIGWIVEFTKKDYTIEKVYKLHGNVINNFEENCDDYRKLMAMIQSDKWEIDGITQNESVKSDE